MPAALTLKQAREKRHDAIKKGQQVLADNRDEEGKVPAEKIEEANGFFDEAEGYDETINTLSRSETFDAPPPDEGDENVHYPPADAGSDGVSQRELWLRSYKFEKPFAPAYTKAKAGKRGTREWCEAFTNYLTGETLPPDTVAQLQSDSAEDGGYLVASEQFAAGLLKELDDEVFIRRVARIHTVREAESLGIRKRTARANTFDWSSELGEPTPDSSLKFGKKVLTPHYLTGEIKVSRDLLRRAVMPVDMIVREEIARDSGEKMEDAYLLGDGVGKPLGLFVPSSDGISTSRDELTGSDTDFVAANMIAAKYSLKMRYHTNARWMFHRDGVSKLYQLADDFGHFLFRPGRGLLDNDPDQMLGIPILTSERVPNTFTAGNYVGLLGDFRYYEIVDALDLEVLVLTELFARQNMIGYIARLKTDGCPTLEEAFIRLQTGT